VVSPETHAELLLEDIVESRVASGSSGAIALMGGPGSGKSAALDHLASLSFSDRILLLDDPTRTEVIVGAANQLVVYTTRRSGMRNETSYRIAPWSNDDVIEYLLSRHPERVASVVSRYSSDKDRQQLAGSPALVYLVLEQFAADDQLTGIKAALRKAVAELAPDDKTLDDARSFASALLLQETEIAEDKARELIGRGATNQFIRLLSFPVMLLLLTADRVISQLKTNKVCPFANYPLPREVVVEIAQLVRSDAAALERLHELFKTSDRLFLPMIVSVLYAVDPCYRPGHERRLYLVGAYLAGAQWPEIDLPRIKLTKTDLRHADLRGANFDGAQLQSTALNGIQAGGACFTKVTAERADFSDAQLGNADLSNGRFTRASFEGADLRYALAEKAYFYGGDFTGASLRDAHLAGACFQDATLQDADLRNANLSWSNLSGVELRTAMLHGANLDGAQLVGCDLEFVQWPRALLSYADLSDAYLTGSCLPRANFHKAILRCAGLADVDWEQADLRSADLRGCSFHMGSSRSGLVGSPYPCPGSRTGFYTNDYDDQNYKAPEQIRKANLRGADLRDAKIDGVDFYLVDLRDAKYDRAQGAHFRSCDAILEHRPGTD